MSNDVILGRNSVQRSSTASDISDLRCAVIHCQLPNILPAGDYEQWPSGHRLPGQRPRSRQEEEMQFGTRLRRRLKQQHR